MLRQKAIDLDGVVFALNGMPDHVHLVVAIPPKVSVAHFVGQIKAVSATKFNHFTAAIIVPGPEYGAFSFDAKRLPNYIGYVERQKEHHQSNTTLAILERTDGSGPQLLHEPSARYLANDQAWRE